MSVTACPARITAASAAATNDRAGGCSRRSEVWLRNTRHGAGGRYPCSRIVDGHRQGPEQDGVVMRLSHLWHFRCDHWSPLSVGMPGPPVYGPTRTNAYDSAKGRCARGAG